MLLSSDAGDSYYYKPAFRLILEMCRAGVKVALTLSSYKESIMVNPLPSFALLIYLSATYGN